MEAGAQLDWSLDVLREQTADYLTEAGYPEAAANLDAEMVNAAAEAIKAHLAEQGDLIPDAIAKDLIAA